VLRYWFSHPETSAVCGALYFYPPAITVGLRACGGVFPFGISVGACFAQVKYPVFLIANGGKFAIMKS
jgi:hypothetical protein